MHSNAYRMGLYTGAGFEKFAGASRSIVRTLLRLARANRGSKLPQAVSSVYAGTATRAPRTAVDPSILQAFKDRAPRVTKAAPGMLSTVADQFNALTPAQLGTGLAIPAAAMGLLHGMQEPDLPSMGQTSMPMSPLMPNFPIHQQPMMSPHVLNWR